jgi:hypothetical protein
MSSLSGIRRYGNRRVAAAASMRSISAAHRIAKFVMPVTEPKFDGRYLPATIRGNNGHADLISFR